MKRVLLINPPDELEAMFGVGKEFVQKYEPLGLLYIAAVVKDRGNEITVIDAHAEDLGLGQLQKRISAVAPDVIGISTLTCNGALVYKLGRWIKETMPGAFVVLGNVHADVYARQYLKNCCCDVVVHGEGEEVFCKLLDHLETGSPLSDIPAISFLDQGEVVQTTGGVVIEDIAKLPLPARDLVDQNLYRLTEISNQSYVVEQGGRAKTLITSRGCYYRCAFCVVHYGRKPRYNDVRQVVDEFEMLQKEYGASYVYLMDPCFLGNPKRVIAICDEYKRRGLTMKWGVDANVSFIRPDLISAMASANCYELSLGIESGVQRLLDRVEKKIRLDKVREAVKTIRDHSDIKVEGLFILGLPGETYQDSLQTIRFAVSLNLDMAQFSICCPYPGSPLYFELANAGQIDTGIRENDQIEPSVWQRYSSYICFNESQPIWTPDDLTVEQLRSLQKKALRSFYLRPSQIIKQIKRLRRDNILKSAKIALRGFF